jgi:tetratricopeptide (TPR) repeat protein
LYLDYFSKSTNAFTEKVNFFETHRTALNNLDDYQIQEIKIDFTLCLFEIGKYERFIHLVDELIEMVISENIYTFNGSNIFNLLLRKKASALINLNRHDKALPIIEELIKINKKDKNLAYIFYLCKRRLNKGSEEIIKGTAIIAIIFALSLKFAVIFAVDPFYSEYLYTFSTITTTLFTFGALLFFYNEVYRRHQIKKELKYIYNLSKTFRS